MIRGFFRSSQTRRADQSGRSRLVVGLSFCLLFLVGTPSVHAHDPGEITGDVHFAMDRIDIMLTQSHLTALAACGLETANRRNFGPRQFAEVKAELEAKAPATIDLRTTEGRIAPRTVAVTFSSEGEIEFRFSYPRPAAQAVNLHAAMLPRLDDPTFVLEVTLIMDGKFVAQHNLRMNNPDLTIRQPQTTQK